MTERVEYDEFGLFHEKCRRVGSALRPSSGRAACLRKLVLVDVLPGIKDQRPGTVLPRRRPALRRSARGSVPATQRCGALASVTVPVLLARGMRPDSVLDDEDERELLRRLPGAEVVHVEGAGHSLQGDKPLELAAIIEEFVFG